MRLALYILIGGKSSVETAKPRIYITARPITKRITADFGRIVFI
jgi:hypothetical protein